MKIPALTTEQMREVDRLMIEEYGIHLLQMAGALSPQRFNLLLVLTNRLALL